MHPSNHSPTRPRNRHRLTGGLAGIGVVLLAVAGPIRGEDPGFAAIVVDLTAAIEVVDQGPASVGMELGSGAVLQLGTGSGELTVMYGSGRLAKVALGPGRSTYTIDPGNPEPVAEELWARLSRSLGRMFAGEDPVEGSMGAIDLAGTPMRPWPGDFGPQPTETSEGTGGGVDFAKGDTTLPRSETPMTDNLQDPIHGEEPPGGTWTPDQPPNLVDAEDVPPEEPPEGTAPYQFARFVETNREISLTDLGPGPLAPVLGRAMIRPRFGPPDNHGPPTSWFRLYPGEPYDLVLHDEDFGEPALEAVLVLPPRPVIEEARAVIAEAQAGGVSACIVGGRLLEAGRLYFLAQACYKRGLALLEAEGRDPTVLEPLKRRLLRITLRTGSLDLARRLRDDLEGHPPSRR